MDAREVLRARSGAKTARQKFAAVTGANNVKHPLEVVQIDHTPADVILVDSFERKAIGRPGVTLAIDIATRMITGYHVSLDAPSRLSIALCLTRAVAPKADLRLIPFGPAAHDVVRCGLPTGDVLLLFCLCQPDGKATNPFPAKRLMHGFPMRKCVRSIWRTDGGRRASSAPFVAPARAGRQSEIARPGNALVVHDRHL